MALGTTSTSGGADAQTDFTIQRADGVTIPISIQGDQTIGDVIDAINTSAANTGGLLVARLRPTGNGIQLVDDSVGTGTLTVTDDNQSTAANSLGLIPTGAATATVAAAPAASVALADSNGNSIGQLAFTAAGTGNSLNAPDRPYKYRRSGKKRDVQLQFHGGAPDHHHRHRQLDDGRRHPLADQEQSDRQRPSRPRRSISSGNGSSSSLVTPPATAATIGTVLQGSDTNPGRTDWVFTVPFNLSVSLTNNDASAAQQAINLLGQASNQVSFARAQLDATMQGLTALQTRQTSNETSIQSSISNVYDVDFASAASQFSQLQIAYQAALQTTADSLKMTLFSYL